MVVEVAGLLKKRLDSKTGKRKWSLFYSSACVLVDNLAFLHGIYSHPKYHRVPDHDPEEASGDASPPKATSSCLLNIIQGLFLIRTIILALLAFVAAVLIAVNYLWRGEWSEAKEQI